MLFKNRHMFIGDFSSIDDALRKTGVTYNWIQTRCVEGLMSVQGQRAKVSVMEGGGIVARAVLIKVGIVGCLEGILVMLSILTSVGLV